MKRNWEYLSIGVCFPSIKNGANIKQIAGANGYPITRIETLSGGAFNRDRMGYANIVDLTKYQDYILESGDLLLSHINSKAYIGRTVKYEKQGDEKIIHGMNLLRLRANPEVISSSLFAYYSKSMKFKDAVARIRKDAVNQSSMAISDLKKIIVPVPPLEEQSRIVAQLDLLTGIIDKQNAQVKELDNLAQAIFFDMFGNRDELVPLSYYVEALSAGKSLAGDETCRNKVLKTGAVTYDEFQESEVKNLPINYKPDSSHEVHKGDVIISRMNTAELVGACAYVWNCPDNYYLPDRLWRAELRTNANPIFIWKTLVSRKAKEQIRNIASGTSGSMKNISKPNLLKMSVPRVELHLQQSFAEKIQSIEKQKETIRASIADTQKLLDYTMDKYFG